MSGNTGTIEITGTKGRSGIKETLEIATENTGTRESTEMVKTIRTTTETQEIIGIIETIEIRRIIENIGTKETAGTTKSS